MLIFLQILSAISIWFALIFLILFSLVFIVLICSSLQQFPLIFLNFISFLFLPSTIYLLYIPIYFDDSICFFSRFFSFYSFSVEINALMKVVHLFFVLFLYSFASSNYSSLVVFRFLPSLYLFLVTIII